MKHFVLLVLALAGTLVVACFDVSNAPSCTIACTTDSECPGGQTCNAQSGTCSAGEDCTNPDSCTPGDFVACVDGAARACNAAGDGTEDSPCGVPGCNTGEKRCNACVPDELTCTTNGMRVQQCTPDGAEVVVAETCTADCVPTAGAAPAHCRYLEPKWLPDICDTVAEEEEFRPNVSAAYSTDLDSNCTGGVVAQTGTRAICVVRAKRIVIPSAVTLTLTGNRAIAFVADTELLVNGTLDAGADKQTSGPGGGATTSGTGPVSNAGGGGAGFAQAGADGGDTSTGNGNAGGAVVNPLSLAAFIGGPRAAASTANPLVVNRVNGGGGGGAVLLAACRGSTTLATGSVIDVGGGGGEAQHDEVLDGPSGPIMNNQSAPGAGGGAGGYVVIQGLTAVTVAGSIFGNGGGGGSGNTTNDARGNDGANGVRNVMLAAQGGNPGGAGAGGGNGGYRSANPTAGGGTTPGVNGGGGGGSMGFIHIFTPMGITPVTTGSTTSPAMTNHTTPTR